MRICGEIYEWRRGEGTHIFHQLGGAGGHTDYSGTMTHFPRVVLCEARKWFTFSEGNEWVLLMGDRQLWEMAPRETGHGRDGGDQSQPLPVRWTSVSQWADT